MLPFDESIIRQVIVRIKSVQSIATYLPKRRGEEERVEGGEEKNMVEYLVLQKRILKGEEGPWLVWGTVEETDPDEILGDKQEAHQPVVAKQ